MELKMEYVIVTKNRLTKYGKIVLAIIIAVVLLVASILIFLSKEKIFQAEKNDNLKVAKKDKERTNDAEKLNTLNTDDGTTKISKIDHKRSNQKNVKKTQSKPKIRKF